MLIIILEKDFFRLMINSTFGKTMKNLRKGISIRLANNAQDYEKWVNQPSVISQKIVN